MAPTIDIATLPKQLYIDGKFVDGVRGLKYPTINPATEEVICEVAEAGEEDVDIAVKAAHRAFKNEWSKVSPATRGRLLYKLADLLENELEFFAALESLDNGKTFGEASTADIPGAIGQLRHYAGWADKIHGQSSQLSCLPTDQQLSYTRHEPVGVVGQIIPWNFPLMMLAWKIAPALAAGCTIVLKLAEQTPLSGLYFAKLIDQVGFPAGTINIISGWGDKTTDGKLGAGAALVQHKLVNKIAFTGSTAVGRIIMKEAANDFKRVTLELGGKSPNIVFPDADLDVAVMGSYNALFFNQGQCCIAASRLFVHEDIYDKFMEKLIAVVKKRKVGSPFDPTSDQGPQVSQEQFDMVMGYIKSGVEQGASLLCGGDRHGDKGYFIQPTVFGDAKRGMKIWDEEIFGPVMCVQKFKTISAVLEEANDTSYGLGAAVFSRDIGTINYVVNNLKAGTVWVNTYGLVDSTSPFGGFKSSGLGREGGDYGLKNYLEVKQVTMSVQPIYAV